MARHLAILKRKNRPSVMFEKFTILKHNFAEIVKVYETKNKDNTILPENKTFEQTLKVGSLRTDSP